MWVFFLKIVQVQRGSQIIAVPAFYKMNLAEVIKRAWGNCDCDLCMTRHCCGADCGRHLEGFCICKKCFDRYAEMFSHCATTQELKEAVLAIQTPAGPVQ